MTTTLIDVREYPEFATGHIEGSQLVPLGTLSATCARWDKAAPLVLICRSGQRAEPARAMLAGNGFQSLEVPDGGVDGWRSAGKPLLVDARKPWAMERQVRVVGSLVLGFVVLGMLVSPRLVIGAGLIGAGLVFAGVSDTCMMGSLLGRMPWNRPRQVAK